MSGPAVKLLSSCEHSHSCYPRSFYLHELSEHLSRITFVFVDIHCPFLVLNVRRLLWWDSLTFVEKRMSKHRDNLVQMTESAIMGEVNLFYQQGDTPDDDDEG